MSLKDSLSKDAVSSQLEVSCKKFPCPQKQCKNCSDSDRFQKINTKRRIKKNWR